MSRAFALALAVASQRKADLGCSVLAVFWSALFVLLIGMLVRYWTIKSGIEGVLRLRSLTRRWALYAPLPTGGVVFVLLVLFHRSGTVIWLVVLCFVGVPFLFFVLWLINAIVTQFQINWLLHRLYRRGDPLLERELAVRIRREVLWFQWLHGPLFLLRGARWRQVLDAVAPLPGDDEGKGGPLRRPGRSRREGR